MLTSFLTRPAPSYVLFIRTYRTAFENVYVCVSQKFISTAQNLNAAFGRPSSPLNGPAVLMNYRLARMDPGVNGSCTAVHVPLSCNYTHTLTRRKPKVHFNVIESVEDSVGGKLRSDGKFYLSIYPLALFQSTAKIRQDSRRRLKFGEARIPIFLGGFAPSMRPVFQSAPGSVAKIDEPVIAIR